MLREGKAIPSPFGDLQGCLERLLYKHERDSFGRLSNLGLHRRNYRAKSLTITRRFHLATSDVRLVGPVKMRIECLANDK